MPVDPNHDLLDPFRRGDPEAAETVREWIRATLRSSAVWIRPEDVDDVTQSVLIALWRYVRVQGFEVEVGLRAIARKISMRTAITILRLRRHLVDVDENLPAPGPRADEAAIALERRARAHTALRALGRSCKEIVLLYYFEKLNYAAIAQRLGRSEATMRVRMRNCLQQVRASVIQRP
jgi:RNA polymerase sigma factor (sigma-70 family)